MSRGRLSNGLDLPPFRNPILAPSVETEPVVRIKLRK